MFPSAQPPTAQRSPALPSVLFSDDFDADHSGVTVLDDADDLPATPAAADEAEPEPVDIEVIRAEAAAEGRRAALSEIEAEHAAAMARLCDKLAASLDEGAAEVRDIADQAADSIANLLIGLLATALPAACAHYGPREVAQLAARVLPALNQAPKVNIRVAPAGAEAIAAVVARLDPEMRERVLIVETETMARGDIRIVWLDGNAVRDSAALWREIAGVLEPLGLLVDTLVGA